MLYSRLIWLFRAWPVLAFMPIGLAHASALQFFPTDIKLVNKVIGTALQFAGAAIVLWSIDANLGLFRGQHFREAIWDWFRSFPRHRAHVVHGNLGTATADLTGRTRILFRSSGGTIEERLSELERRIEELRTHMRDDFAEVNKRIATTRNELLAATSSNAEELKRLSAKLETSTVGGFKEQLFGVLLAMYGTGTGLFA